MGYIIFRRAAGIVLLLSLGVLSGCETSRTLKHPLERPPASRPQDAVVSRMQQGLEAHYAGDYARSNQLLSTAEAMTEALYTQSITEHAGALVINDGILAYAGESFEKALLNLFMSLNYIFLGQWDDALVEARKVDTKLNAINAGYPLDYRSVYAADAFIRLVMGLLYDARSETNDAMASYRQALTAYDAYRRFYRVLPPDFLSDRISALDFPPGSGKAAPREETADTPRTGTVHFIQYTGLCPVKKETAIHIPYSDGYAHKIAAPVFEPRPYSGTSCEISLEAEADGRRYRVPTVLCEDIGGIAGENLNARITLLKTRSVVRAVAKGSLASLAGEWIAPALPWAQAFRQGVQSAGAVSEKADLRSWDNLPDRINMATVHLPAGSYRATAIILDDKNHSIGQKTLPAIAVTAGGTLFTAFRTVQ